MTQGRLQSRCVYVTQVCHMHINIQLQEPKVSHLTHYYEQSKQYSLAATAAGLKSIIAKCSAMGLLASNNNLMLKGYIIPVVQYRSQVHSCTISSDNSL